MVVSPMIRVTQTLSRSPRAISLPSTLSMMLNVNARQPSQTANMKSINNLDQYFYSYSTSAVWNALLSIAPDVDRSDEI